MIEFILKTSPSKILVSFTGNDYIYVQGIDTNDSIEYTPDDTTETATVVFAGDFIDSNNEPQHIDPNTSIEQAVYEITFNSGILHSGEFKIYNDNTLVFVRNLHFHMVNTITSTVHKLESYVQQPSFVHLYGDNVLADGQPCDENTVTTPNTKFTIILKQSDNFKYDFKTKVRNNMKPIENIDLSLFDENDNIDSNYENVEGSEDDVISGNDGRRKNKRIKHLLNEATHRFRQKFRWQKKL
uniref:Uncharacterized protein n=1 Tax=Megaviridae environmental sample TaxID=1737588 RepID=A0A5J6VJ51_9VIRU|nr:MAG: hypothetical protein [Megaviridae environmental sample]